MQFMPDSSYTPEEALVKGLLYGGLGIGALYGVNELRKYIWDKLQLEPGVYSSKIKYIGYKLPEKYSNDGMEKAGFLNNVAFGFGIPTGAVLVYNLLKYLNSQDAVLTTRNLLRRAEVDALAEMETEFSTKDYEAHSHMYKDFPDLNDKQKEELKKTSQDKEINEFLDINVFQKKASASDVVQFLTTDMITKYLPVLYGMTIPAGFLAGYYGMRNYMDDGSLDPKDYDVMASIPEQHTVFVHKDEPEVATSFTQFTKDQIQKAKNVKSKTVTASLDMSHQYLQKKDVEYPKQEDSTKELTSTLAGVIVPSALNYLTSGMDQNTATTPNFSSSVADNYKVPTKDNKTSNNADKYTLNSLTEKNNLNRLLT